MLKKFTLLFYLMMQTLSAQNSMQAENFFETLETYPKDFTSGNIITRWIDGLGYRYYWATEGLKEEDLIYKPSPEALNTYQTLEHIYGLVDMVANTAHGNASIRPNENIPYDFSALRKQTLGLLFSARTAFAGKNATELAQMKLMIQRKGKELKFPIWHLFNGPAADALYHVGQVVSFRRSSGNPINPNVNVFLGKNNQ